MNITIQLHEIVNGWLVEYSGGSGYSIDDPGKQYFWQTVEEALLNASDAVNKFVRTEFERRKKEQT